MSNDLTLAQRLEQANNSAAQSWIITELLLNAYPLVIRESVMAAAVPHWFTPEILTVLLDLSAEEAHARYGALQQLSLVQPFGGLGCTLHDLTRNGILKNLVTEQRTLLQHYSEKLLTYFVSSDEPQREVERIYHLLIVNPDDGRRGLQQMTRFWRRKGDFAALENLLRHYRELIELGYLTAEHVLELEQQEYRTVDALADYGKREKDEQSLRKAIERFAPPEQLASLLADEPTQWREQVDSYKQEYVRAQLESARTADDRARQPFWIAELATIQREQEQLEAALQGLNEAVALFPDNANTLAQRGETYRLLKRYEEALVDFARAIELDVDAWTIGSRGQVYQSLKRYDEALADFDRAIALDMKWSWAFGSRGQVYQSLKRYDEALADFNRAIELDEKNAWAIGNRGLVYWFLERFEEALSDYNLAIELNAKYVWAITCRGLIYKGLGQYAEAVADLDRAIALDEKYVWAIAKRGETNRLLKRYEEALADFDRAIALDAKMAWAIANRGETNRLLKRYEEALADFDRAIALDAKMAWAIANRGETNRLLKRYEEALVDFDRAIALDEKYTWAIASRGQVYQSLKRHGEALADFDRAIALDEKMDWVLVYRGLTYQALKRYQEALTDLNRAIELDEQYSWAIEIRGYIYLLTHHYPEAHENLNRSLAIRERDWALYCRGLYYTVQNETEAAYTDLIRAIELANIDYSKDPQDWQNTLNLMLYHLVAGDLTAADRFWQEAFDGNAPMPHLQAAVQDLEELLMVLPNHAHAPLFLDRITAHLAKLRQAQAA